MIKVKLPQRWQEEFDRRMTNLWSNFSTVSRPKKRQWLCPVVDNHAIVEIEVCQEIIAAGYSLRVKHGSSNVPLTMLQITRSQQ